MTVERIYRVLYSHGHHIRTFVVGNFNESQITVTMVINGEVSASNMR